jgi:hypothetical protein
VDIKQHRCGNGWQHGYGVRKCAGDSNYYGTKHSGHGKYATCVVTVTNKVFNTAYTSAMKSDFNSLLGSGKKPDNPILDLFYKYTPAQCVDIILTYDSYITDLCNTSGYIMPKALVQSLLMRELWCVNSSDDLADAMVIEYFFYKEQCETWENGSIIYQLLNPYPTAPIPLWEDSSTGLGQMFAATGISAINNARSIGLTNIAAVNVDDWHDCETVWYGLKDTNTFNIMMVYYEIFNCAAKNGESIVFSQYNAAKFKALFTRYNGTGTSAVQYGEEVYEYYLIFSQYNNY